MKVVDLRERKDVNAKYTGVSQPMYVFDSTQELREHVNGKVYIIIYDLQDLHDFLKRKGIEATGKFEYLLNTEVYIATNEKYIVDKITQDNIKIYKFDENNKPIKTDNCYIRLFVVYSKKNRYLLFTSSGIHFVSLGKYEVTAGVKNNFRVAQASQQSRCSYNEKLDRILSSKKTYVKDLRLFNILFNPLSDCFMDIDTAVKRVYGSEVRKADREKIIKSEKFRNIILKEFNSLMPGLQKAIQTEADVQKLAKGIVKIMNDTINSEGETVDNKLKAWSAVASIAHPDEIQQAQEDSQNTVPFLAAQYQGQQLLQNQQTANIKPYKDDDFEKRKKADEEQAKEQTSEKNTEMSDEEYKILQGETESIQGYVVDK